MKKEFDIWNTEKQSLELTEKDNLVFHEREIWWCSIGINLGDEQDGKNDLFERPVLVLKKFNDKIAWVLPLSSKIKEGKYYYSLNHEGRTYTVLLSQMRLVSVKRFRRYVRKISQMQFNLLKDKVKLLL